MLLFSLIVNVHLQLYTIFFFVTSREPPNLHSFPTRRSSDLERSEEAMGISCEEVWRDISDYIDGDLSFIQRDRKSTRLNSSHRCISYAVFCLKKKKKKKNKYIVETVIYKTTTIQHYITNTYT